MAPEIEQAPLGLRLLMWLSLLSSVFAFLDLISTFYPLYPLRYAFPETPVQRALSIAIGLSFAPLFYGIRRRLAVTWKLGWIILIVMFSWFLAESLKSLRQTPQSGGWIASTAVTIVISVVAIYWGRWWTRQKNYFSRPGL